MADVVGHHVCGASGHLHRGSERPLTPHPQSLLPRKPAGGGLEAGAASWLDRGWTPGSVRRCISQGTPPLSTCISASSRRQKTCQDKGPSGSLSVAPNHSDAHEPSGKSWRWTHERNRIIFEIQMCKNVSDLLKLSKGEFVNKYTRGSDSDELRSLVSIVGQQDTSGLPDPAKKQFQKLNTRGGI